MHYYSAVKLERRGKVVCSSAKCSRSVGRGCCGGSSYPRERATQDRTEATAVIIQLQLQPPPPPPPLQLCLWRLWCLWFIVSPP